MKKLNQSGFAITVMLYSILALVSMLMVLALTTMSGSRKNNADLIDHIKNDLNNSTYDKVTSFAYKGSPEEFTVVKEGYYKIDLFGASGSVGTIPAGSGEASKGASTSGTIYLKAGQKIYFYVGQKGFTVCNPYTKCMTPVYNGGGLGGFFTDPSYPARIVSGGGATDVRLVNGSWNDLNSLKSRIMVAGGGGSSDNIHFGSHGGTLAGVHGKTIGNGTTSGGGGTQTAGGSSGENAGSFGIGGAGFIPVPTNAACNDAFGGGGGYYGGGGGVSGNPNTANNMINGVCAIRGYAGGGSSFISGYAGSNAISSAAGLIHTNAPLHYSGKYFENGVMSEGVNTGDGKASIQFIGTELSKKTDKLNNVRYIKDCTNGNTVNNYNHWEELQAMQDGVNVAHNKIVTGTVAGPNLPRITDGIITPGLYGQLGAGLQCITIDLLEPRDLDEVAVWHYYEGVRSYNNHSLSVSSNNTNWTTLIPNVSGVKETPNGIRFSAY